MILRFSSLVPRPSSLPDNGQSSIVNSQLRVEDPNFVPDFIRYRSEYERNVEAWANAKRQQRAEARLRFCAVAACAAVAILLIAATIAKTTKHTTGRDVLLNSFQAPGPFSPAKPAPYEVGGRTLSEANREGGLSAIAKQLQSNRKAIAQLQANEKRNGKTLEDIWTDHTNRLAEIENFLYLREQSAPLPNPRQLTGRANPNQPSRILTNPYQGIVPRPSSLVPKSSIVNGKWQDAKGGRP